MTSPLDITRWLTLITIFLVTDATPAAEPLRLRLDAILEAHSAIEPETEVESLVRLDRELRILVPLVVDAEKKSGEMYYRDEYAPLGLSQNHWSGLLDYDGALIKRAHTRDPQSPFRSHTLFSEIEADFTRNRLPSIASGHQYLVEFPEGPFAGKVCEILATFYDDLYKSCRGLVVIDSSDNHELYAECYKPYMNNTPIESQMIQAQALAIAFYERALAFANDTPEKSKQLRAQRDAVRNGTTHGWHWCSAC